MRLAPRPLAALLATLALAGCGPKRIPGSDIRDTPATRAIIAVINAYQQAAERLDAAAILALVSPRYFDDAGTPDPADDIDYDQLRQRLASDYAKIAGLRLDFQVRRIDVDDGRATAYVFYDERYRIKTNAGEVARQASDIQRMRLVLTGDGWKFLSGL